MFQQMLTGFQIYPLEPTIISYDFGVFFSYDFGISFWLLRFLLLFAAVVILEFCCCYDFGLRG